MAFPIELLVTNETLIPFIQAAIQPLNIVQKEFRFELASTRLLEDSLSFKQQAYTNEQIFEWLQCHKSKSGGNRPFIILVIDKPLSGMLNNLFGSHRASEGFAWFTTEAFASNSRQFLFDKTRFCRYYLVRYALSFVDSNIKSHETKGCMFDKKIQKRDLLLSLATGNICDDCLRKMRKAKTYNIEAEEAIDKMLQVVSNQHPRALIMKGGGVKGLALIGALKELEKYFTFDTFAGTSAGAIAASLLGAGYRPTEIEKILDKKEFNDFKDGFFRVISNLLIYQAKHSGKNFMEWIDGLIKQKKSNQVDKVLMRDLPNRTIMYATTVGTGLLRFDTKGERKETSVAFATRCSMSIPYFFRPERIEKSKVCDGGLGYNFPLKTFITDNGNSLFLGLYLTSDVKKEGTLFSDLRDIVTDADERQIVDRNLDKIVIIDPRPIKTTQFKLSKTDKEFLLQAGKVGALEYLNRYHPDFKVSIAEVNLEREKRDQLRIHISGKCKAGVCKVCIKLNDATPPLFF